MSLAVNNLEKHFGGNRALDGASLKIIPNKINLLMGANGSGKTTLINCVSGLISDYDGSVVFSNSDISGMSLHDVFKHGIIRTFQTPRLFSNLSVLENLLLAHENQGESFRLALLHKKWRQQESDITAKALKILDQLDMSHLKNTLAYDCSGGQIKLLELGKALMSDAKLVILDEPIAGINPALAHKIFERITSICRGRGTTFLIIEHRLDIALKYADHAFVLDNGRIIADDAPDRILSNKKVIESYLQ